MKEPMPCKYALPPLIVFAVGVVLFRNGEFGIAMILFVAVTSVSIVIGESQFWVEKKFTKEGLYPGYTYEDYVVVCKRNERNILSLEEWAKYVKSAYYLEEI